MSGTKHCSTCTCDGAPPKSAERIQQGKLFSGVPATGCLDYRNGKYCGKPVDTACRTDRCKEHYHA